MKYKSNKINIINKAFQIILLNNKNNTNNIYNKKTNTYISEIFIILYSQIFIINIKKFVSSLNNRTFLYSIIFNTNTNINTSIITTNTNIIINNKFKYYNSIYFYRIIININTLIKSIISL